MTCAAGGQDAVHDVALRGTRGLPPSEPSVGDVERAARAGPEVGERVGDDDVVVGGRLDEDLGELARLERLSATAGG
jgi:hypothetical protein